MKNIHCLILLCIAGIFGCKQKNADFSSYIFNHTEGIIPTDAPISVQLGFTPSVNFDINTPLPDNIFNIEPKIEGDLFLMEGNRLEFIPRRKFDNGTSYEAVLNLGEFIALPKNMQKFRMKWETLPLGMKFEGGELRIQEDGKNFRYEGGFTASDLIEDKEAETSLCVEIKGKKLPIVWEHRNFKHMFSVRDIPKEKKSYKLRLKFGKLLKTDEFTVDIPSDENFSVIDRNIEGYENSYIRIILSESISPDQDLRGLISLKAHKKDDTYETLSDFNYGIEGNIIILYLNNSGYKYENVELRIDRSLVSVYGKNLGKTYVETFFMPTEKPDVRFIGKGEILPPGNKVVIPFSAVALKAVDVQIVKVFEQNMNFFLQEENYNSAYGFERVGRPVYRGKIELTKTNSHINPNKRNEFYISLNELLPLEKGVIYNIRLSFRPSYTTLPCAQNIVYEDNRNNDESWDYGYDTDYYFPADYKWEEHDNPCSSSYYTYQRFPSKNVICTSLGLMVKKSQSGEFMVNVNDISTTKAVTGCQIEFYNYQNQIIGSGKTDERGFLFHKPQGMSYTIIASYGNDKTYLKVNDGSALSLSNFDVGGMSTTKGVKGFIYGEREIWRPGDDIHLSLILQDKANTLPEGHPVTAELINPQGNTVKTQKFNLTEKHIYAVKFTTPSDAPTGYWQVKINIGGIRLNKTLRIETIKPNRINIETELSPETIIGKGACKQVNVRTSWMHGGKTANLNAETEVTLRQSGFSFKNYEDHTFYDISRKINTNTVNIFKGKTDENGSFTLDMDKIETENAPGILKSSFMTKVFEPGGDFSVNYTSALYSPYSHYVGIKIPEGEYGWHPVKKDIRLEGVVLNPHGEIGRDKDISLKIYKIAWHWWWDSQNANNGVYIQSPHTNLISSEEIHTADGKFSTDIRFEESGRYYIYAKDETGGHSCGIVVYAGNWSSIADNMSATVLAVDTDKKEYNAGDSVKIGFPSETGGVAVITLEDGIEVKETFRIPTKAGRTYFSFIADAKKCPNTYISVSMLQPYSMKNNDRPIRMFGLTNINVKDVSLELNPEIRIPEEIESGKEFTVEIKEKNGKKMEYTIAVVDQGLLSISSFKTPNPFRFFYSREALGVRTWDLYDYIYGAYGARLDKAFAVGGDSEIEIEGDIVSNRFKPVVIYEGPFSLNAGEKRTHKFFMPEYIGMVRTMVIAAGTEKYGSAEAYTKVTKPLMIMPGIPRTFRINDIVEIPVTVFTKENSNEDINVEILTDNRLTPLGQTKYKVSMNNSKEKTAVFRVKVTGTKGATKIHFNAYSEKYRTSSSETVEIQLPNSPIVQTKSYFLNAENSIKAQIRPEGAEPKAKIEISRFPSLNTAMHMENLKNYPHRCAEQITSRAFPLLNIGFLTDIDKPEEKNNEYRVKETIQNLRSYSAKNGGFCFWPGNSIPSEWLSSYVLHFLTYAKNEGYNVPDDMWRNTIKYIKRKANYWRPEDDYDDTNQAYRLYVLALAGTPEPASMNLMKGCKSLAPVAAWLLAGAYNINGDKTTADGIVSGISRNIADYKYNSSTYGSSIRDQALLIEIMTGMGMQKEAFEILKKLSQKIENRTWLSTQESAVIFHSAGLYAKKYIGRPEDMNLDIFINEIQKPIRSAKAVYIQGIDLKDGKADIKIKNNSHNSLYIKETTSSIPLEPITRSISNDLKIKVRYLDINNRTLTLENIKQASEIIVEISVENPDLYENRNNLVLSYFIPGGCEFINERLSENASAYKGSEFVDIRDDRCYLYFGLGAGRSQTFRLRMNATFTGEYIIPSASCTSMYDNDISAYSKSEKLIIVK